MNEALILAWLLMSLTATYGAWKYRQLMHQRGYPAQPASSVVIVPIKGHSAHTGTFITSLLEQDHPNFRVIFAVESLTDPAVAAIEQAGKGRALAVDIVSAGLSLDRGQKVLNLTKALEHLTETDEFIVMADADVILPDFWLTNLNWAVVDQRQEIVTGYRLIVPASPTLAERIVSSINLSVALAPRVTGLTAAWGGTMAMQKTTLDKLDLARFWREALSDDLQLTAAAREQGVLIHTSRRTLLVTPWSGAVGDMFAFGVRQFRILRLNEPFLFVGMIGFLILPIVGFLAVANSVVRGEWLGLGAAALLLASACLRQRFRWMVVEEATHGVWNMEKRQSPFDFLARPLWWPTFLILGLSGAIGRTIRWAGVTYRCKGGRVISVERARP